MNTRIFILSVVLASSLCVEGQGFTRTYGAYANDIANSVRQVYDSSFVILGTTGSFGFGNSDVYLIKADLNGDIIWSKTFGSTEIDQGMDIRQTLDSGLVITGYTNSFGAGGYDVYLIRTDRSGTVIWEKTYGGPDWDFGHKVLVLDDGGFCIIGDTYSYGEGNSDLYLIRTDQYGDTLWTKTYGGAQEDLGRSLKTTADGGMILAGGFGRSSSNMDAWMLKTDALGDTSWSVTVGGDSLDIARDVVQTLDMGYSAVGMTESLNPWVQMLHFKTDMNGVPDWENAWGPTDDQEGYEMVLRNDGGFITTGYIKGSGGGGKDFFTQRFASNGFAEGGRTNGGLYDEESFSMDTTYSGRIVMVGTVVGVGFGQLDELMVVADSTGDTGGSPLISIFDPLLIQEHYSGISDLLLWPNPAIDMVQLDIQLDGNLKDVSVELIDLSGRSVKFEDLNGSYSSISVGDLNKGSYIVVLKQGAEVIARTILVKAGN